MKKLILMIIYLTLISCASTYKIPKGKEAYLINQRIVSETTSSSLLFVTLDGKRLKSNFFTAPVDDVFIVPSGKRNIVARIVYRQDMSFFHGNDLLHEYFTFEYNLKPKTKYKIASIVTSGKAILWLTDEKNTAITKKMMKVLVPVPKDVFIPVYTK